MIILYVDDDRDDVETFCDALKTIDQTISCMTARDGEEALALLDQLSVKPDFIFLDINMPMMDGKQCLKELKKRSELKHIPVIMYSTSTNPTEKAQCVRLGAHRFLVKQGSYSKLCAELEKILSTTP